MTAVLSGTNGLLQSYDYQAFATGFDYTFSPASTGTVLVMNPAGTLATGTIRFPTAPVDGMTITFSSSQQITALTLNGSGANINNAVTLLPAKTAVSYVYRATGTTWWPTQTVPGVLTNGMQLYRLNADLVGANVTTAQSILGVGVTLAASTVYAFEMVAAFSKTAGATSHAFQIGFGGTATVTNIAYDILLNNSATSFVQFTSGNGSNGFIQTASATTLTTNASATLYNSIFCAGMVSINTGGTFIPQYTLSVAPGGAYTTATNSYMKIYPIGASGSATNIGSWA
jgi:hypothetical protein